MTSPSAALSLAAYLAPELVFAVGLASAVAMNLVGRRDTGRRIFAFVVPSLLLDLVLKALLAVVVGGPASALPPPLGLALSFAVYVATALALYFGRKKLWFGAYRFLGSVLSGMYEEYGLHSVGVAAVGALGAYYALYGGVGTMVRIALGGLSM